MRRRRDELDARCRKPQLRDVLGHLASGQLAALAGFGTLCNLDLDLLGRVEIFRGHTEASRGDLLDLEFERIAFLELDVVLDTVASQPRCERLTHLYGRVAATVLTAFAGVGLAADPVHRHRKGGVRFRRDRAERHGPGGKAPDDILRGLDLFYRYRGALVELELEQPAQRHVALRLVVDDLCVLFEGRIAVVARRVLQLRDRIRGPHMLFATHAECILAAGIERAVQYRVFAERGLVDADRFFRDFEHADAFDIRRRAGEIFFH